MKTLGMLLIVTAIVLSAGASATADQICNHRFVHGEEVTVARIGSTSCQLARSGAENVIDLGHAPEFVIAYSSVTHMHYRMVRISLSQSSDFFTCTYRGKGAGRTTIGFRLTILKD
jgi:hypothetical protein